MAAPKENLLSLGHLNGSEKNTFTKQREFFGNKSVKKSVLLQEDSSALHSQEHLVIHLHQRWQELKEREYTAQQQNRQLLQEFEKAQDTLNEMLARNAAMKMIRTEYERYLEANSPRWQQQLKEKTQAAQKKRMDEYLRSGLKNAEERVTASSAGPATKSQKTATPQEYSDYNRDGSSHLPHTQSSWLTHNQFQTARFPIRVPHSFLQPPIIPHPFPLHYPASVPEHHYYPWPGQDPRDWASPQPNYPWSQPAGTAGTSSYIEALWGHLYKEEPSRDSKVSEKSVGSRSSHLSQELDIKPVRLSSGHAESSESGSDSCLASRERKKERGGRKKRASSDRETCSSLELSRNPSAILVPSVAVAQSSESNPSSEKSASSSSRRTKRSGRLSVESQRSEKVAKERTRGKGDDAENQHSGEESGITSDGSKSEKVGNQSHKENSDRCKYESRSQGEKESGSDSIKTDDDAGEKEEQESGRSEQSSTEETVEDERKKNLEPGEDGEEKENSQTDEEQGDSNVEQDDDDDDKDEDDKDEDLSDKKDAKGEETESSTEAEMEEQGGKEKSNHLKNEGTENQKLGSASSQDKEDVSEGSGEEDDKESNEEEGGESEKEEEHGSEEAGGSDQTDSDDCIITPQDKRSKQMWMITEEAAPEEEEGKMKSSDDDSNEISDEDIENLLAPQEQTQNEEKSLKADEKPKAIFHNMGIFQVEHDKLKTDDQNDSDQFDHFYD